MSGRDLVERRRGVSAESSGPLVLFPASSKPSSPSGPGPTKPDGSSAGCPVGPTPDGAPVPKPQDTYPLFVFDSTSRTPCGCKSPRPVFPRGTPLDSGSVPPPPSLSSLFPSIFGSRSHSGSSDLTPTLHFFPVRLYSCYLSRWVSTVRGTTVLRNMSHPSFVHRRQNK